MSPPFPVVQTISSPSLTRRRGRRVVVAMNLSLCGTRSTTSALRPQSLRGHLRKLLQRSNASDRLPTVLPTAHVMRESSLGVHRYKPIPIRHFCRYTPNVEVPNRSVDMDSWDRSACYPRGTFYPLSDGPSTWDRRITRPCFRICSTCRSRSQAPLCPCTRQLIADQLEGTFGRLRYNLGGDRPSQTTHLALSLARITGVG